jgi:hypothetical protein
MWRAFDPQPHTSDHRVMRLSRTFWIVLVVTVFVIAGLLTTWLGQGSGSSGTTTLSSFDKIVISANTYQLTQDVSNGAENSKVIRDTQKLIESVPDARNETKRHAFNRAISIVADYCARCADMLQDARP